MIVVETCLLKVTCGFKMCFLHKWCKWVVYKQQLPAQSLSKNWELAASVETRQMRQCDKCGKTQDKLVSIKVLE